MLRYIIFLCAKIEKIFKKTSFLARIDVESVSCYGNHIIKFTDEVVKRQEVFP